MVVSDSGSRGFFPLFDNRDSCLDSRKTEEARGWIPFPDGNPHNAGIIPTSALTLATAKKHGARWFAKKPPTPGNFPQGQDLNIPVIM